MIKKWVKEIPRMIMYEESKCRTICVDSSRDSGKV